MQTQAFQRSSVQTCINTSPRVCITFGSTIWASKIIATTTFSNSNNTHWLRFITIFIAGAAYNRYLIDIIKGSEHEIIFNHILWILGIEFYKNLQRTFTTVFQFSAIISNLRQHISQCVDYIFLSEACILSQCIHDIFQK